MISIILTGFLFAIGATLGFIVTWATISKLESLYSQWRYNKQWADIKKSMRNP